MEQILYLPAYSETIAEYRDAADLRRSYENCGCGGLEIIRCDYEREDEGAILKPEMVRGVHMIFYPVWLDFWRENEKGLMEEFGDRQTWEGFYGGEGPSALTERFTQDLEYAKRIGAKYVVFHVSDVTIRGVFTHRHTHTDREAVEGAVEIINQILEAGDYEFDFLMENLWWPGLTMTEPAVTKDLLDGVRYEKKGIMLDLGHLMCSNMELTSEDEAIEYVHRMLDGHEKMRSGGKMLTEYIKGVHMHQSVTGTFAKKALAEVREQGVHLGEGYYERFAQVYQLLGQIDTHRPFSSPKAKELIRRIGPRYLVHELMAKDREERERVLAQQSALLE